jgi:hypothetical protein
MHSARFKNAGPSNSVGDDIRRPARMRLEFLRGIEKDSFTAKPGINSRLKEAAHFRAEGSRRDCLPGYVVFLVAQLRTPFASPSQIENLGVPLLRKKSLPACYLDELYPCRGQHSVHEQAQSQVRARFQCRTAFR